MRKAILPILIAISVLSGVGYFAYRVMTDRQRQYQKVEIPESYLEISDTSRFSIQPIELIRIFPDDSVFVFFPETESRSQLYLYNEANYNRLLFGDHHGIPMSQPQAEGYAALFGRPVLNFSGYPEGKYYVHVTQCNFGGFIQIAILNEKK
jgi:hypothetical protein